MKLRVKKTWQGKVAIRDKYMHELRRTKEDLTILCEGRKMIIPFALLEHKFLGMSKQSFFDKFSGESHRLAYFDWKPTDPVQQTLL